MAKLYNLARMTTSTVGTGTITLGSAITGYLTFANAGVADGDVITYAILDGSNSEIGRGTYTASGTTLTRSVLRSTNSNNAISLSGSAEVFITAAAEDFKDPQGYAAGMSNGTLAATVAGNALTIALKTASGANPSANDPVLIPFRNATAATGDYSILTITAATSLVISSGSTMGAANATAFRLWVVGFNDAGTFRLGAVNARSGANIMALRNDLLLSSTAEGGAGAADSAQVIYTGTAVTSKALRVLGYLDWGSGLTTAGTWASAPTKIQLFGPGGPLPGHVVQIQRVDTGIFATGTTTIPDDNTIPQNTEGNQYMTQALTPTAATNILQIDAQAQLANSVARHIIMALFDGSASALAATETYVSGADSAETLAIRAARLAAGTSSITFSIRAGATGGAGTMTFNGWAGAQVFNGTANSFIEVREVMA